MKIRALCVPPLVEQVRKLPPAPNGVPALSALLRGNIFARMILLVGHPQFEDYADGAGIPFTNAEARIWTGLFSNTFGQDLEEAFLLFASSRFGNRVSKASTEHAPRLLKLCLPRMQAKAVVCVGMEAFATTFAHGRKGHARTIIGNPMFLPGFLPNAALPVYVLPDEKDLVPSADETDYFLTLRAADRAREKELLIHVHLEKFKKWAHRQNLLP